MDRIITELKQLLKKHGYKFREENSTIYVELPNNFGELDIAELDDGDDIIGLVGSDWHTHSECLGDPKNSSAIKIIAFINDIFSGRYLLIEELEPGKAHNKTIKSDLKSYLKYLPKGTEYIIYNKT